MAKKDKMHPNFKAFASECPNCGKRVYVTSPKRSAFCSRACEANYNYSRRFIDKRRFEETTLK